MTCISGDGYAYFPDTPGHSAVLASTWEIPVELGNASTSA